MNGRQRRIRTQRAYTAAFCSAIVTSLLAAAQNQPPPTIVSEGSATATTQPEYVDFWLTLKTSGDSLEEAAKKTLPFEDALKKSLEDRGLSAYNIEVSSVNIADLNGIVAVASARLRFQLARFASPDKKVESFGAICDSVRSISAALDCHAEGPLLGVSDHETVEQEAVSRATENALYRADAVAALMQSQIYAVQSVTILDTTWNGSDSPLPTAPDVETLSCTATVLVTYLFAPIE